jgi:hypothetical protein
VSFPISPDRATLAQGSLAVGVAALFLAIAGMPFGYYALLRVFICILSIYLGWEIWSANSASAFIFLFVGLAVVYNPVFPLRLGRGVWLLANIITIGIYLYVIWRIRNHKSLPPSS